MNGYYISFSKRNISITAILLIVLIDCNFCYLFSSPTALSRFWGPYNKLLIVVLSFVVLLATQSWKNCNDKFLKSYCLFLIISFCFVSIVSTLIYPAEKIYNHFLQYGGILLTILAIPLLDYFKNEKTYESFLNILNQISFVIYIFFIIQAIFFKIGGPFFLQITHTTRYGNLRMGLSGIANIMVLFNYSRLFGGGNKKPIFYWIQFILGMVCVILIQQTRAYVISFLGIFLLILLVKRKKTMKQWLWIILITSVSVVLLLSGYISTFLDSFTSGTEVGSTIIRQEGYWYFLNEFIKNPFWGHGFLTNYRYKLIKTGPLGHFYYADTGILGLMAQMGILGIILYVWPIIHWIKILYRNHREMDLFLLELVLFWIFTASTLIVTNPERVIILPICFALFAFSENKVEWD